VVCFFDARKYSRVLVTDNRFLLKVLPSAPAANPVGFKTDDRIVTVPVVTKK
jgi:hypothetical protein